MPAVVHLELLSACRTLALNRLKSHVIRQLARPSLGLRTSQKCTRRGLRPGLQSPLATGGLSTSPCKKTVPTKPLSHGQGWDECTALTEDASGGNGRGFMGRLCK